MPSSRWADYAWGNLGRHAGRCEGGSGLAPRLLQGATPTHRCHVGLPRARPSGLTARVSGAWPRPRPGCLGGGQTLPRQLCSCRLGSQCPRGPPWKVSSPSSHTQAPSLSTHCPCASCCGCHLSGTLTRHTQGGSVGCGVDSLAVPRVTQSSLWLLCQAEGPRAGACPLGARAEGGAEHGVGRASYKGPSACV